MLKLLLLMRADPSASMRMAAAGPDGARQQVAAINALGGEVEGQWVLLGRYDLAVVASFPNDEIAAAYCLTANAGGYATEVHYALPPSKLAAAQALIDEAFSNSDEESHDPVDPPSMAGEERR